MREPATRSCTDLRTGSSRPVASRTAAWVWRAAKSVSSPARWPRTICVPAPKVNASESRGWISAGAGMSGGTGITPGRVAEPASYPAATS